MGEDDVVVAAKAPSEVKAAAAFCCLGGLFIALTGVQLLGARWHEAWRDFMPYVFIAIGLSLIPIGAVVYRGGHRAALMGLVLCAVSFLGACGWFVISWGSVFSLMNIAAVPLALLGTIFCALALGPTKRMAEARERLADEGLHLGF